ncbi:hypothetical protein [Methanooceanicella nereidis]|uniref:hypothetical protein n=1 Tax=Methanooceanicella nereidis TaxID=2052831 RepID=UPI001E3604FC|nr:hypothetical protein [Methanocella sp. CWC-04]
MGVEVGIEVGVEVGVGDGYHVVVGEEEPTPTNHSIIIILIRRQNIPPSTCFAPYYQDIFPFTLQSILM